MCALFLTMSINSVYHRQTVLTEVNRKPLISTKRTKANYFVNGGWWVGNNKWCFPFVIMDHCRLMVQIDFQFKTFSLWKHYEAAIYFGIYVISHHSKTVNTVVFSSGKNAIISNVGCMKEESTESLTPHYQKVWPHTEGYSCPNYLLLDPPTGSGLIKHTVLNFDFHWVPMWILKTGGLVVDASFSWANVSKHYGQQHKLPTTMAS